MSVAAPAASFELVRGEPRRYLKIADDGGARALWFCAECGSPLYSTDPERITSYNLRVGCLEQRSKILPKRQIWRRSKLSWSDSLEGIPSVETE